MHGSQEEGKQKTANNTTTNLDEAASSFGEDEGYEATTMMSISGIGANGVNGAAGSPPSGEINQAILRSKNYGSAGSVGVERTGWARRIIEFSLHGGIPSLCLYALLMASFLLLIGHLGLAFFPEARLDFIPIAFAALTLGYYLLGFVTLLALLHVLLILSHQGRLLYSWAFVHYISEVEPHTAIMVWTSGVLLALTFDAVAVFCEKWLFGSTDMRIFFVKIAAAILIISFLLAIKRHYMTGLAMSFNYSNYKDRIQESLFADHILNLLRKSRHTYKFRQRLRFQQPLSFQATCRMRSPHHPRTSLTVNDPTAGRMAGTNGHALSSPMLGLNQSLRSAAEIFSLERPQDSQQPTSPTTDSSMPQSPTAEASNNNTRTPPNNPPNRSVADYLTESDKKKQFSEFFKLANKTTSRFSNLAGWREDVASEANRIAQKLYKYLCSFERDYLLGQDLLPYIEDEAKFVRAIALIKRHCESSHKSPSLALHEAAAFAFGLADLTRAIDSILSEIYMTAKSLQTIETALDKIDFIFTLLVLLIMIIIVAIAIGGAVKLLLALSTMLSAAAFAFGTSAKNMFESMIFLLVIHPFDVGDRVFVPLGTTSRGTALVVATMAGDETLDNLVVAEMHLLSTVFERWDGVKLYVPNYILAAKPIFNIRRSGSLQDLQIINIDFSTPTSKIEELKRRLEEYVRREQADFTDFIRVYIDSMESCNRINLVIAFQHIANWQDLDMQLTRRTKMLTFIKNTTEDLKIGYMPPLQRVAIVPAKDLGKRNEYNLLTAAETQRLMEQSSTLNNIPI